MTTALVTGASSGMGKATAKRGTMAFDLTKPQDRNEAIALSMKASLDNLSEQDQRRYRELAIFPEDSTCKSGLIRNLKKSIHLIYILWGSKAQLPAI